ncbi:hypothetical protein ACF0H5_011990 [Mactra antiquata]
MCRRLVNVSHKIGLNDARPEYSFDCQHNFDTDGICDQACLTYVKCKITSSSNDCVLLMCLDSLFCNQPRVVTFVMLQVQRHALTNRRPYSLIGVFIRIVKIMHSD